MDIPNRTRSHRPATKPSPSPSPSPSPNERFLGAYLHALPNYNNPSGDELTEADILWSSNNFTSSSVESNNNRPTPPSSVSSTPRHRHNGFSQPETFGILAALAEQDESPSAAVSSSPTRRSQSSHIYHHHKAAPGGSPSSSKSSPSYAQMIPKPPPPQDHHHHHRSFASSAPVNVPVMSAAMRMKLHELEALDDDVEDDDGEMLPPHEYVARSSSQSPILACSVLEGVGRTLKGRDLRRVRNAIWRRTGFID